MISKNDQRNTDKTKNLKWGSIVKIALGFILLALLIFLGKGISNGSIRLSDQLNETVIGEEGRVETISAASIKEVFEINELSTAEYIYNSIARAYEEDGTTIRYYVAYEGTIKAGIDFNDIDVNVSENEKLIIISIPKTAIQDIVVNPGSLEYIFVDEKSETETVLKEAFELCQEDLEEKALNEKELLSLAQNNAETIITALIQPWIMQVDKDFKITFE